MGANPYFSDDDDLDILEEEATTTVSNNSVTSPYHSHYKLTGPNGQELPPEIQEALSRYINLEGLLGRSRSSLPVELQAMSGMLEFFTDFTLYRLDSPLLTALGDVVDRMSDGLLREFYELHEAERRIIFSYTIKKFQHILLSTIDPDSGKNYENEVYHYIMTFIDITEYIYETAVEKYKTQCNRLDIPVDEHLIDQGILERRTWTQYIGMSGIPARADQDER